MSLPSRESQAGLFPGRAAGALDGRPFLPGLQCGEQGPGRPDGLNQSCISRSPSPSESMCNGHDQSEQRHDNSSIHSSLLLSPPTTPIRAVGLTTRTNANRQTILGPGPMSQSSGPIESGLGVWDAFRPGRPAEQPEAHRPSVPRDGLHANVSPLHVSSATGSQAVSAHALRAIRVSNGSVPWVAHRPSVPHAGVESCPASRALFDAGGQVCSDRPPSRSGPFTRISESPLTPHFSLT